MKFYLVLNKYIMEKPDGGETAIRVVIMRDLRTDRGNRSALLSYE